MNFIEYPRLCSWWGDDCILSPDDPSVRRLVAEIDPNACESKLDGTMNLNLRLEPKGLVLHVHQPFVSRQRLVALQRVRQFLGAEGLVVPTPLRHVGANSFRCSGRWAELESYVPHQRPDASIESFRWLFVATGSLHRTLARMDIPIPRPMIATYAPPRSLRRWLRFTADIVLRQRDDSVHPVSEQALALLPSLQRQWIPTSRLPNQFVHGDVRLDNLGLSPEGKPVYLDFDFLAMRPRIHDLAYALSFIMVTHCVPYAPDKFDCSSIPGLIDAYESAGPSLLTPLERQALTPYVASLHLYYLARAGFTSNPGTQISLERFRLPLIEWLLTHPDTFQLG